MNTRYIDTAGVERNSDSIDPGNSFGSSIALDGDALVVGAVDQMSTATGIDADQ